MVVKIFIFFILIPALIFFIGKKISSDHDSNLGHYRKLASIIKLHPKIVKNFIGNFIMFSPVIYFIYILYGVFDSMFYFSIVFTLVVAMIFHIRDVSGKPIDIVLSNFLSSFSQLKQNFFMRFIVLMTISCIFTGFIMIKVIYPIAANYGIISIELNNDEQNEN